MKKLIYKFLERKAFNFYVSGDFDSAEKHFLKLKNIYPDKIGHDYNLGLCLMAKNKYDEAEKYLKNEIKNYGNSFYRNRAMGDLYYISGKRHEAKKQYELCLKDAPENNKSRYIYKRIKNCEESKAYKKAVESYNFFIEGSSLLKNNKYTEAHDYFKKAADLDNTSFHAFNNLGVIELNYFNNKGKAMKYFNEANNLMELPAINKNINIAINS